MTITVGQIEELRRKLDELPPPDTGKREISKQEAIALLADQVAKLQQRGYALDDIAHVLKTNGLTMSVRTLKTYLSRARRSSKPIRRHMARTPEATPPPMPPAKPKAPSRTEKQQPVGDARVDGARNESSTGIRSGGFVPREDSPYI